MKKQSQLRKGKSKKPATLGSPVYQRIYRVVQGIPKGTVATYGWVAKKAKTHPRVVGQALHRNPDPKTIPCHRVVNAKGKLSAQFAFGGLRGHIARLKKEGVKIREAAVEGLLQ
jgi:O-6-methylguanine DNA methyltransferase